MDDHLRVTSVASGSQQLPTQDPAHAEGSTASALARPLTQGLFTLPEEEDTVVRAVPAQILALSRAPEDTKTIPVPRELLELSRREQGTTRAVQRRDESELPVWDAWYGSADHQDEPVFDLRPSPRVKRSVASFEQQPFPIELSAEDLLLLEAMAPAHRVAARTMLLTLATLCVAATYWVIH